MAGLLFVLAPELIANARQPGGPTLAAEEAPAPRTEPPLRSIRGDLKAGPAGGAAARFVLLLFGADGPLLAGKVTAATKRLDSVTTMLAPPRVSSSSAACAVRSFISSPAASFTLSTSKGFRSPLLEVSSLDG